MSKVKLKPCPFCCGEARLEQIPSATWDKFVVTCKSPKCCAYFIGYADEGLYDSRTKAIEAWNTRKHMDNIVEQLEEMDIGDKWVNCHIIIQRAIEVIKAGGIDD